MWAKDNAEWAEDAASRAKEDAQRAEDAASRARECMRWAEDCMQRTEEAAKKADMAAYFIQAVVQAFVTGSGQRATRAAAAGATQHAAWMVYGLAKV